MALIKENHSLVFFKSDKTHMHEISVSQPTLWSRSMRKYAIKLFKCVLVSTVLIFSSVYALDGCSDNMVCQIKRYKELNKSLNDEKKMRDEIEYLTNEMRYKAGHSLKVK